MIGATAALKTLFRLSLIGDEAVQASANKSLEAGLSRIVAAKVVLLDSCGKETLGEVLGVFVCRLPLDANVFVSRFPVALNDGGERALTSLWIITARSDDRRMPGYRE